MKKNIILLFVFLSLLVSCHIFKKDEHISQGTYKLELSSLLEDNPDLSQIIDQFDGVASGMLDLVLKSVDVTVDIVSETEADINVDAGLFESLLKDIPLLNTGKLNYQIRQDSLLFVKDPSKQRFSKCAVVTTDLETKNVRLTFMLKNNKFLNLILVNTKK